MNELLQHRLGVPVLRRIDAACDQFEEAWCSGRQPRIEEYLTPFDAAERPLLLELLQKLQQELILNRKPLRDSGQVTMDLPVVDNASAAAYVPQSQKVIEPSPISSPSGRDTESPPRVTLRVIAGPHSGQEFTFTEHNTLFAGRLQKAQLRLENDLHFSRHHFRLEVNPPTCYLMDLNSRNHTFVNGEQVKERFLKHGDIISGGKTKLVVEVFDPRQAMPVPEPIPVRKAQDDSSQPCSVPEPRLPSAAVAATVLMPLQGGATAVQIAGYQVHEPIGAGDLGTVYRATRLATGEVCALKVITPAAHSDEHAIQSFLREASILNQLQHPHIVRLIEMGASGQVVYLATEYVASESWERLIKKSSPSQRIRLACGLMNQILGALEYAHARSLVHRDVKPGNLLITRKEGKLTAKLADFGLAKQYSTAGMSQVTRDGDVIGSLPFMSPDQFLNSREARPTCDLYSAGATLYWMLTGKEPIPMESHPCKFLAILESPATPIQQYNSDVPNTLAQIIHRALEKTPERRFASAAEMRQQLREFTRL
jgi:pSer/pThr/pTyr-binding forkhead associated (FHA) protein